MLDRLRRRLTLLFSLLTAAAPRACSWGSTSAVQA